MAGAGKNCGDPLLYAKRTYHAAHNRSSIGDRTGREPGGTAAARCSASEGWRCQGRRAIGVANRGVYGTTASRSASDVDKVCLRPVAWHRRDHAVGARQADHGRGQGAQSACDSAACPRRCRGERRAEPGQGQRHRVGNPAPEHRARVCRRYNGIASKVSILSLSSTTMRSLNRNGIFEMSIRSR